MQCRKRKREPQIAPIEDAPELYLYIETAGVGLMEAALIRHHW